MNPAKRRWRVAIIRNRGHVLGRGGYPCRCRASAGSGTIVVQERFRM
jgi:hypothetical protein